jgi:uncharacterized membrane protein YfcA
LASYALIIVAAFAAGAINSIAGGGTLLSFPALIWIGVNPVMANATNTLAIWPGSFAGVLGFRSEVASLERWLLFLTLPSLAGGVVGAVLLLHTPEKIFARIVPLLILSATVLFATHETVSRRMRAYTDVRGEVSRGWIVFAFVFQFFVGIYGGYFGAAMGILMLAALGLIGLRDLHQMNGLKNLLAISINGVAAVYFAVNGAVVWRDVAIMAIPAVAGGYAGARMAHRFGPTFVRRVVVGIGLIMTVALFVRQ